MKSFIATLMQLLFTFSMYIIAIIVMGLSLCPGLLLCQKIWAVSAGAPVAARFLFLSFGIATAYILYGIFLIMNTGTVCTIFNLKLKEGEHHITSLGAAKWAFANALHQIVSATFMDFILLTPLANIFYRLMGARIGKNVQINSKFCADLSLLEVGDGAVIGGHATVICHSFERNRLILKKVKIGNKAIIGLNSVILPGCEIGDGALIAAGAVIGKNTKVEPHSVYCGVPAEPAKDRKR